MKTAFKTILVLMLCFCLTVPALSEGTGSAPVLIFEDSFNGEALDRSKWAPCPNWVRQDGLSVWDSKLIRLNGQGQLVLRAEWDEKARRVRAGAVRGRHPLPQVPRRLGRFLDDVRGCVRRRKRPPGRGGDRRH